MAAQGATSLENESLLIPSVPPRLGKCKIISVNYSVALEVENLNVEIPIVIGSIPQLSDLLIHSKVRCLLNRAGMFRSRKPEGTAM